jgi:hypothetical protein
VSSLQKTESDEFAGQLTDIISPANEQNRDRLTAEVLQHPSHDLSALFGY